MSAYTKFDTEIYSEELFSVTEAEHDAAMTEMWEGYSDWSQELEEQAWRGSKPFDTPRGDLLIKKACEHPTCSHFKCERGLRMGGFEL
jgi:hypothetical protein